MYLCGEGHVNVDCLAMQQLIAAHKSRHLQLHAEGVAVVDQACEDVLVQIVLQLLQHALDAASDGLACRASLHIMKAESAVILDKEISGIDSSGVWIICPRPVICRQCLDIFTIAVLQVGTAYGKAYIAILYASSCLERSILTGKEG